MGLGVLESKDLDHVPGTTRYFDEPEQVQTTTDNYHGLKVDDSSGTPIILSPLQIPQPSDDPNDPLNWPLWKRDLITFVLSITAIFATALGPILAANTVTIALLFRKSFTDIALLTGYFLLGVGAAAIFFVPSGRVWGKRHLFILGICILIGSSAWAGAVGTNYKSLIGARVIQGIGCAPFETLVNAAVGDLYYVHQRGSRMAFTNLAVFGGAFFTPIVVGKITHSIGWWWTFYLEAIFLAVSLPAVFFLCPETAYRRDAALNTDMAANPADQNNKILAINDGRGSFPGDQEKNSAEATSRAPAAAAGHGANTPKKTFVQSLNLFDGNKTDESYWKLLLRPFPLFVQPAFLWGCLIQGTMIGWTVFIGVIVAAIFLGPPYYWNEVYAGYAYVGAFVGALIGFIIAGVFSDWSVHVMTRRNGGVYEPEFRIVMVIPMFIIGSIGLYGFGITAAGLLSKEYHYIVPLVFFGFEVAGMVIGAVASSLYIVDAYRDLAIEGFTCMIIFKNMFSFGLTYGAYDWVIDGGIKTTMIAIASIQVVVCALSIPMYIYGKRVRAYFHKHDLLELTGLR
ncbi:major facilitator superfamily transporter [Colletotrichum truncatum]|uniref:Major facilitator superfamily transporter n=1 Tax=Colletotrichum truncatum TaxID=5467 RepID=A0ACC3YZM3_COLTU|nr:major facilitator superfamily transporter [Colletotrichum truncatum]KAF6792502.1 major facilitator superfamily transporter [Colletotrichum truncatum]